MSNALVLKNQSALLAGPLGSEQAYVTAVSQIPILSKEEEVELATRFRDDKDLDAARTLVVSHLRFVVHIARGYNGYGLPFSDIIQEGNVGLMKAVKRFDPSVGVRLVSFAVHWIRAEIHEYVLRNWRMVKVATTKAQRKLFFNLRKKRKNLAWLSEEESHAMAKDLGVSVKDVREMEGRLSARDLSFDPTPSADGESDYGPATYLPDSDASPETAVAESQWQERVASQLAAGMATLDERSQDILRSRYLGDQKDTLQELAERHGVSAERIRQVESAAISKLKTMIDA